MSSNLSAFIELRLEKQDSSGWNITLEKMTEKSGVGVWRVSAKNTVKSLPPEFSIAFDYAGSHIHHLWHAGSQYFAPQSQPSRMTPDWCSDFKSAFNYYQPIYAFIGDDDKSYLTVAVNESRDEVRFRGGVGRDNGINGVTGRFIFFSKPDRELSEYEVFIRVDLRCREWYANVQDAAEWIHTAADLPHLNLPVIALDPVYSTWYSHGERINAEVIERECTAAAKCGIKTVIVDDGWQTDEPCNYRNAGDWNISEKKFPDMKSHVAKIHALGMKYVMWYALPYLGHYSEAYTRFKDKMILHGDNGYGVLDPRYPEVRKYLAGICAKAMTDWDVDGFKLDYLDTFKVWGGNDPGLKTNWEGMDTRCVSEASEKLLKEVSESIRKIKADSLVEFRQHYTGPAIRQYCNMLRVADCPCDTFANRCAIAAMRVSSPGVAIHSDMLAWDQRTSVEDAALQILNCLFGTIQYSPRFSDLPESHRVMIRHWVKFSVDHREALQLGVFRPHHPELNYTVIEGETGLERVVGVYDADAVVKAILDRDVYIFNATPSESLVIETDVGADAEIFDTLGIKVGTVSTREGLNRVAIPPSGYLIIHRINPATLNHLWTKFGKTVLASADEAFTLQLLDKNGIAKRLRSCEFKYSHDGNGVHEWRHENGLSVRLYETVESYGFSFRPEIDGIPDGYLLEWFDGPQLNVRNDTALYWPFYDGCEVTKYDVREGAGWSEYRPLGYVPRRKAWGALYPGSAQMQFMAAYRNGLGIYFAAEDRRHTPKAVEFDWMNEAKTRLSLQTFCGDLKDGRWTPDFRYVVRSFTYDADAKDDAWQTACSMYREWVYTLPELKSRPKRPAWMRDAVINLIYPVTGEGIDHGPENLPPNCYFPYVNVMPYVEKYSKLFDSKLMCLLMHWEGTAPWAPPYVWPPLGGEEKLAALRDALHKDGNLLGLYCSGTAWTQFSTINGYSQEKKCADEGLERHMMRGPHGELEATICNDWYAQRFGYDMCLTEKWSIDTLCAELEKIASFGVDYCQYFDQNIGGGALLCYSRSHNHPPVPGAWQTDAMLALQQRLSDVIHSTRSSTINYQPSTMIIGCEGCAATPYVGNLFYNDSRECSDDHFGRVVPGVPFVFHEWMCNFSGNQIGRTTDPLERWTQAFHYGDMFSVILARDGKLAMAWGVHWNEPLPEQEPLIALVKKLNGFRKKYPEFLLEGRMIKPFVKVPLGKVASFWEAADGRRIGFISDIRGENFEIVFRNQAENR